MIYPVTLMKGIIMKLKNINIEERMKHYNVQGLSITLLEEVKLVGQKITAY